MDNIHTTIATKISSEESSEENEELNYSQITYNKLMFDSLESYQHGDLTETIRLYSQALNSITNTKRDGKKLCLLKANLGIVLYQNCEYKKGMETLEEALTLIKNQNPKSEYYLPLLIKILVKILLFVIKSFKLG